MRLKVPNVFRRQENKPEETKFNFWRTINSTASDILHDAYFYMMPKTDYTYSRSPSYRRKVHKETYLIPNMSRKELRGRSLNMDGSDLYISSEEEEEGGNISDEEVQVKTRTVYEDGILLRSGHSLRSMRSVLEKEKRLKSSSSKHSEIYMSEKSVTKRNRSLSTRRSHSGISNSNVSISRKSHMSSRSAISTIRTDLSERFDELEMEKGMKEIENHQTRKEYYIPHLHGPDLTDSGEITMSESEEDFAGTNSSGWSSYQSKYSGSSGQEEAMSSVTTVTTTVITTVLETIVSASRPIVEPVWTTVGKPVWNVIEEPVMRYVVNPVVSVLKTMAYLIIYILTTILSSCKYLFWSSMLSPLSTTVLNVTGYMVSSVQYLMMRTVLADTWILFRRSRSCCFCLPLLLILPFLFTLLTPYLADDAISRIWSLSLFPSPEATRVSDLQGLNLKEEVRRIIIQLQRGEDGHDLTESDVERITRDILKSEIDTLRLSVTESQNQHALQYDQQKQEQDHRFEIVHQQLIDKISEMEVQLAGELKNIKLHDEESSGKSSVLLGKLQEEVADLKSQLQSLSLSQQMFDLQVRNCCRNDSFYSMLVHTKVNQIMGQMMLGQPSGDTEQDAFTAWLFSNFVNKNEFDSHMRTFAKDITDRILEEVRKDGNTEVFISDSSGTGGISEQVVRMIVDDALQKFSADKLGLPDFALESSGGSVINTRCSQTYYKKTAQYSILGIPLWYTSNSPRTVIQPEVQPGSCWAFHGDKGYLVIELSALVTPTAFTVEHIPKSLSPDGEIKSAPKDMMVLGLSDEKDVQGTHLSNFTYNENGKPLQYFRIQKQDVGAYRFIEIRILNNHGNPTYTCLYRIRVHGNPFREI